MDSKNDREDINLVQVMTKPFEASNSIILNSVVIANKKVTYTYVIILLISIYV